MLSLPTVVCKSNSQIWGMESTDDSLDFLSDFLIASFEDRWGILNCVNRVCLQGICVCQGFGHMQLGLRLKTGL